MTMPVQARGPAGFLRRLLEKWFGSALRDDEAIRPVTPMELRSLQAMVPLMNEAEQRIVERIADLASQGALDEGSGHVLDEMITSWVRLWADNADGQYQIRLHQARTRVGREELNISRHDEHLRLLDAELSSLDEELEALLPRRTPTAQPRPTGPAEEPEPPSHTKPASQPQEKAASPEPAQDSPPTPGEHPSSEPRSATKPYDQQHQPPQEQS